MKKEIGIYECWYVCDDVMKIETEDRKSKDYISYSFDIKDLTSINVMCAQDFYKVYIGLINGILLKLNFRNEDFHCIDELMSYLWHEMFCAKSREKGN